MVGEIKECKGSNVMPALVPIDIKLCEAAMFTFNHLVGINANPAFMPSGMPTSVITANFLFD